MIDGVQTEIGPGATYEFPVQPDNSQVIGGKIIPLETTALLLAGTLSVTWFIPLLLVSAAIGLVLVRRNRCM